MWGKSFLQSACNSILVKHRRCACAACQEGHCRSGVVDPSRSGADRGNFHSSAGGRDMAMLQTFTRESCHHCTVGSLTTPFVPHVVMEENIELGSGSLKSASFGPWKSWMCLLRQTTPVAPEVSGASQTLDIAPRGATVCPSRQLASPSVSVLTMPTVCLFQVHEIVLGWRSGTVGGVVVVVCGGGGVCGSDDSKHAVSVQGHADYAPNWVAEHLGASSQRPRHPFPAQMAGEPLAVYLCTRP